MAGIVAIACLVAIGVGFSAGGILGGLTGLIVTLGAGSGLAILVGAQGTDLSPAQSVRGSQRIGGAVAALGCLFAGVLGGWQWGWITGLIGYATGMGLAWVLGMASGQRLGNQIASNQSEGLPEAAGEEIPVIPFSWPALQAGGQTRWIPLPMMDIGSNVPAETLIPSIQEQRKCFANSSACVWSWHARTGAGLPVSR